MGGLGEGGLLARQEQLLSPRLTFLVRSNTELGGRCWAGGKRWGKEWVSDRSRAEDKIPYVCCTQTTTH